MSWLNKSIRKVGNIGGQIVWEDLRAPATGINPAGTIAPPAINTDDGSLSFTTADAVCAWFQMSHDYKEGSDIHVHIHWSKTTTNAGTVNWQIKYKWGNIGDVMPGFSALSSLSESVTNSNTVDKQALASLATISGVGKTISSMLCVYLVRTASGDSYADAANLYEIDVHYERDTVGSLSMFTKL